MEFEWDEQKRLVNIDKHGIDFNRAKEIWQGAVLEAPSESSQQEIRFLAIGKLEERTIAVVFTWRGNRRRLISARRARKSERETYEKTIKKTIG